MRDARVDTLSEAFDALATWLVRNGIEGWDPYDVRSHPALLWCQKQVGRKTIVSDLCRVPIGITNRLPLASRRMLGLKPTVNAKGVGLLLGGWTRAQVLGVENSAEWCTRLFAWLRDNQADGYSGACWGYPFDWQNRILVPRGTPSAVVSATCGNAILDYAEATGNEEAWILGEGVGSFLANDLNRFERPDGATSLCYTPLDDFRIHNASLMAAEYLLRAGLLFSRTDWVTLAETCLEFTVAEQLEDGSFEYWSQEQMQGSQIDNYHSGFVLRSLQTFSLAGYQRATNALDVGWDYYRCTFLDADGRVRQLPGRDYPVDIHSCAESILCPAVLSNSFGRQALDYATLSARWTLEHLQNPDGSYAYQLRQNSVIRMSYLRWGQAWMFRALAELLVCHASAERSRS